MHTDTEILPATIESGTAKIVVAGTVTNARKYLDAAAKFARCSAAMQIMAGFEMAELKKLGGWVQGGRRGQNRNVCGFAGHDTWEDFCRNELEIGERTAANYIAMAEAAKPRLKKVEGFAGLLDEILHQPVTALSEENKNLLTEAVKKITDGRTQMELFEEWGISKKRPVPATGGALGGAGAPRHQPTEEEIREAARRSWTDIMASVLREKDSFTALDDAHQEALQLHLEALLNGLKWWKSLRPSQRGPATRRELLDLLKVTVA